MNVSSKSKLVNRSTQNETNCENCITDEQRGAERLCDGTHHRRHAVPFGRKPLSEISISELCDRAGVGRVSFYRNFQEKDDILKEHIRQLFREWTGTLKEDPPLDELIRRMFSHFEAHRDFYALLQKRGLTWLLKDVILSVCGFHPEQGAVNAYASAFAAYSLYGWVEVWFLRGMKESAKEMAELFAGHSKE